MGSMGMVKRRKETASRLMTAAVSSVGRRRLVLSTEARDEVMAMKYSVHGQGWPYLTTMKSPLIVPSVSVASTVSQRLITDWAASVTLVWLLSTVYPLCTMSHPNHRVARSAAGRPSETADRGPIGDQHRPLRATAHCPALVSTVLRGIKRRSLRLARLKLELVKIPGGVQ